MKFSTYTQSVKPNTINAHVNTSVVKDAFGTGGKELGAWASAANQIAGVIQKKQDEDDAADIMAARSEIGKKVNESLYAENGLVTTGKGKNAQGLSERINQSVEDITNEVAGNYNGRVRYQLTQKYLPQDLEQYGRMGMQTENRERESYQADAYKSRIADLENNISLAAADPESAYKSIKEGEESINSWGLKQGWDDETLLAQRRNFRSQAVSQAVKACAANEDYDGAYAWLTRERKNMNSDDYTSLYASIKKQKKIKDNGDIGRKIFNQYYNEETGELDVDGVRKAVRAACTNQSGVDMAPIVEKGYEKWAGQTMPNGRNGCVEAAVRIIGTDNSNPWVRSIQGETYVPTLVQMAAGEGGPGVVAYSPEQVEAGDMIIYGDDDHVVVSTGGYGYVGNSSSQMKVVKGSDYTQMSGLKPTKIIKSSHLGGNTATTFDADKYDEIMNSVTSHYGKQNQLFNIGQRQREEELEAKLTNADTYEEQLLMIEQSGLSSKKKRIFSDRVKGAQKKANRAAAAEAKKSMGHYEKEKAKYEDSWNEQEDLATLREYKERMDDPDDTISATDQRRYNKAARRYNYYHGTGTADLNSKDVLKAINDYKNKGYSYEEIWNGLGDAISDETKEYYLRAAFSE